MPEIMYSMTREATAGEPLESSGGEMVIGIVVLGG